MKEVNVKENDSWIMRTFKDETTTKYEIVTNKGFYRGGKIYFNDKIVEILSWKAVITMEVDWCDVTKELVPDDGTYTIPAWIPNLFYFPVKTIMTETFPNHTRTDDFEKYRKMKK